MQPYIGGSRLPPGYSAQHSASGPNIIHSRGNASSHLDASTPRIANPPSYVQTDPMGSSGYGSYNLNGGLANHMSPSMQFRQPSQDASRDRLMIHSPSYRNYFDQNQNQLLKTSTSAANFNQSSGTPLSQSGISPRPLVYPYSPQLQVSSPRPTQEASQQVYSRSDFEVAQPSPRVYQFSSPQSHPSTAHRQPAGLQLPIPESPQTTTNQMSASRPIYNMLTPAVRLEQRQAQINSNFIERKAQTSLNAPHLPAKDSKIEVSYTQLPRPANDMQSEQHLPLRSSAIERSYIHLPMPQRGIDSSSADELDSKVAIANDRIDYLVRENDALLERTREYKDRLERRDREFEELKNEVNLIKRELRSGRGTRETQEGYLSPSQRQQQMASARERDDLLDIIDKQRGMIDQMLAKKKKSKRAKADLEQQGEGEDEMVDLQEDQAEVDIYDVPEVRKPAVRMEPSEKRSRTVTKKTDSVDKNGHNDTVSPSYRRDEASLVAKRAKKGIGK